MAPSINSGEYQVEISTKENTPLLTDSVLKEKSLPEEPRKKKKAQWGRLLALAKPEWILLSVGTVALFLGSLTFLVIPAAAGIIVNAVVDESGSRVSSLSPLFLSFLLV